MSLMYHDCQWTITLGCRNSLLLESSKVTESRWCMGCTVHSKTVQNLASTFDSNEILVQANLTRPTASSLSYNY